MLPALLEIPKCWCGDPSDPTMYHQHPEACYEVAAPAVPDPVPTPLPAVSLTYTWSDGTTMTRVDVANLLTDGSELLSEGTHRERLILRALLEHTLATLKGEDVS
jgi:hypothetical protein